jgi:hypothetical protein
MLENRVRRKIFGPERDMVTGEWRRLQNEELYAVYSSPNVIRMTKSRRTRWAWHLALMGKGGVHKGFWWGDLRERDYLEDVSVDGGSMELFS